MMQWGTKKDAKRNLGGELSCFLCSLISMISFCAMGREFKLQEKNSGKTKDFDTHNLHGIFVCLFRK